MINEFFLIMIKENLFIKNKILIMIKYIFDLDQTDQTDQGN